MIILILLLNVLACFAFSQNELLEEDCANLYDD